MKLSDASGARALSNTALAVVALWTLIGFGTWHELVSGVRVGIPITDNGYGQPMLFDGPVQVWPIFAVVVLHACAAIIGYAAVVRPIWGKGQFASEIWLLLGGIVPGTLILMTLSRIVTLILTHAYAPSVVFTAIAGAAVIAFLQTRRQWHQEGTVLSWQHVWPAIVLLFAIFVFTIQMDRFHILGEASMWFRTDVYLSNLNGIGTAAKLPLVSQHYDEAALLYPVIYGLVRRGGDTQDTLSVIYWIMVSLGRASVGSLVYIGVRSFRVDRLSSLLCVAFVCTATLSINPLSSRLLFDALNPLAYALHIARFLIPVLPFLLVSALIQWQGAAKPVALVLAATLGAGLSAMPIHAITVLAWALPVVAISEASPALAGSLAVWRTATVSAVGVLVAFMLAYGLATRLPAAACVAMLLASSAIGALVVVIAWLRLGTVEWRAMWSAPVRLVIAMCFGYGIGITVMGNIFIPKADLLLAHFWPWSGIAIANRDVGQLVTSSGKLQLSPYCSKGYNWGFRTLTGHCGSLPMLVRSYGLSLALMAGVIAWRTRYLSLELIAPDRKRTMMLCGILICLLAMPISFVAYDFVAPSNAPMDWQRNFSIWARSRLIEPWFYSGILLSLAFFLADARALARRWVQFAMLFSVAVGGLVPLVIPAQLVVNFVFLFRAVLTRF